MGFFGGDENLLELVRGGGCTMFEYTKHCWIMYYKMPCWFCYRVMVWGFAAAKEGKPELL